MLLRGTFMSLGFHSIDVEPELRDIGAKGGQVICQARSFIGFQHHREGLGLQRFQPGVPRS